MNTNDQQQMPPWQDEEGRYMVVSQPRPDDGVRNALLGSFTMAPAIPPEFARLLECLR